MGKGWSGAVLTAMGARTHHITVTGSTQVNERFIIIHLHSSTLLNPEGETPGDWIRVWFPDPDRPGKSFQRGYTIMNADPASGTFDLGFVLHEPAGPASKWATRCVPGEMLEAMRYSGQPFQLLDPPPRGYLLLGDLASWPGIVNIIESVPGEVPVLAYLVSRHPLDEGFALPSGPNISAHWVPELPDAQALVSVLGDRDLHDWYAWVASEATETRFAKTFLQQQHNLGRANLHAQAYWVRGREMGTSRDDEVVEVTEAPAAAPDPTPGPAQPLLEPARRALITAGVVQGLLSLLQVVPFLLFAELARLFLRDAAPAEFLRVGAWALAVMVVSAVAGAALMYLLHRYDAGFSAQLRRRLVAKLGRMPLGWFGQRDSGGVRTLVTDNVSGIHYLIVHAVVDVVGAAVTPLAVMVYLFTVDWRLGLVLLLPVLGFVVLMFRISTRDRDKMLEMQRHTGTLTAVAQKYLTAQETTRIFGDRAVADLPGALRSMGDFLADWQRATGPGKMTSSLLNRPFIVLALLVAVGWLFIAAGWTRPVDLIPFLILGTSFGGQLMGISHAVGGLGTGLRAKSELELLLAAPELSGPETAAPENRGEAVADLSLRGVGFGYVPERRILHNLNLELAEGTVTALVGPSGAGKSTIAALIARMWDPDSGTVALGSRDIRSLSQEELYRKVAVLLQDVHLIHGTIAENIALHAPGAGREEIERAATAAQLDAEITALEQGYDTVVRDGDLSGGQRQRIGIARALLTDAEVVVLDEPTAAADPATERALAGSVAALLKGRTAVVVAHRLHTIRSADRILVIDDGRVVEDGTHDELIALDGEYTRLWHSLDRRN